jgi:ABC-type uncharacterized transport system substrate-binding protein
MFFSVLKRLWPPILIIVVISAILILTESKKKRENQGEKQFRVAIFKFSSRQTLEDTEKGFIAGLAEKGFVDGEKIAITRYNAENDLPTAYTIATEIIGHKFDMVITASTPAMQVMAKANKEGKVIHLFGTVTDPFNSGVGIDRKDPFNRPRWLAGIGTFQPVKRAFLIAKAMNPGLKKIGVVWCASETCSEACVRIARHVCDSLRIELDEATVDNSTGVYEAAKSLVSKGVDAIWIGGDNTVEIAANVVIKAGNEGNIPVFTNNTDHPPLGALFALGANYYQVGLHVGHMAAAVLSGAKPGDFSIDNVVPEKLIINGSQAQRFKRNSWIISNDIKKEADVIL